MSDTSPASPYPVPRPPPIPIEALEPPPLPSAADVLFALADDGFEGPILVAEPRQELVVQPEPEPAAAPEPAAPLHTNEPEELQIARRVAAIDVERGHLFDNDASLYDHDIVSEMQRLTLIAEDEGAYDHEAARIARLAFAVKHGLEAVLPQYARGYGKLAAVIRGVAEDGDISASDRERISQIAAFETASVTGPVVNAPDVHVWQETFDHETLSALAVDQAYYEAARVNDMDRAAAAVGIAIGQGEHDYSGARQISMAAMKSAEALKGSDTEHQALTVLRLLQSSDDADRVRGTLALRVLLEGHNHPYVKADLAFRVVSASSDERLAALDPATAARLMLALQRTSCFQAITPLGRSVSLMPERSEFEGTTALAGPQDARFWSAERCDGPRPAHSEAVVRLRAHGPKHMSYVEKDGGFSVRYTPQLH